MEDTTPVVIQEIPDHLEAFRFMLLIGELEAVRLPPYVLRVPMA